MTKHPRTPLYSAVFLSVVSVLCVVTGQSPVLADEAGAAIASIRKLGGTVRPLRQGSSELEVEFQLDGKSVTDDQLAMIVPLKSQIVLLNLKDTQITGKGLAHVGKLPNLRWLHVERTKVGDDGLEHLANLPKLEYLNLYRTEVSDKGVASLMKLKSLKKLYVWQTKISKSGVERIEQAIPGVKVVQGVDLSKLVSTFPPLPKEPEVPKAKLKWIPTDNADLAPKSKNGENLRVLFENHSKQPVRVYWVGYDGVLKIYAKLKPGAKHSQNTYENNTWLITDDRDKPLGYFLVGPVSARAIVPEKK